MRIEAIVQFNDHWAYVFNQPLQLRYREEVIEGQRYLIGRSGPFLSALVHKKDRRSKAFAGREFHLPMEDGTARVVKDVWWHCASPFPTISFTCSSIPELQKCYVFSSCEVDKAVLNSMLEEYDNRKSPKWPHPIAGGFRYPYWEYDKILKHDNMRRDLYDRIFSLEKKNKAILAEARRWKALAEESQQ